MKETFGIRVFSLSLWTILVLRTGLTAHNLTPTRTAMFSVIVEHADQLFTVHGLAQKPSPSLAALVPSAISNNPRRDGRHGTALLRTSAGSGAHLRRLTPAVGIVTEWLDALFKGALKIAREERRARLASRKALRRKAAFMTLLRILETSRPARAPERPRRPSRAPCPLSGAARRNHGKRARLIRTTVPRRRPASLWFSAPERGKTDRAPGRAYRRGASACRRSC